MQPSQEEYYISVAYSILIKKEWFDKTNKKMIDNMERHIGGLVRDTEPDWDERGRDMGSMDIDLDKEMSLIEKEDKYKDDILEGTERKISKKTSNKQSGRKI